MDFKRVAVDDGSGLGHVGQGWSGKQAQGDGEGAHGYSVPRLGQRKSPTGADLPAAMSASLRIGSASPPILLQSSVLPSSSMSASTKSPSGKFMKDSNNE